jgi:NADH dehydrogenase
MVLAEIAVGLLLIAGLFTALASIASIGMGLMVWISSMAPFEMLWYIIASVALIGGSGSTLGADYYVLPYLKGIWKKLPLVKRWYLYTD